MASMQDESFFCIPGDKMSHNKRIIYCSLCLGSATAGIAGAAWQIYQWKPLIPGYRLRRTPSPNPMIVLCLALVDLLACSTVIARASAMLLTDPPIYVPESHTYIPANTNNAFLVVATIIEALNTYFYGATFLWTVMYAADIYFQMKQRDISTLTYHTLSWIIPAVTTIACLFAMLVGDNIVASCSHGSQLILRYVSYYILILVAMLGNPTLYVMCNRLVSKRIRESGLLNSHNQAIISALQRKFLAVIVIFTICWLPNLVDIVIQITVAAKDLPASHSAKYFPIWALEAILNPLQGLLNCFVYGRHLLFRPVTRHEGRLFGNSEDFNESSPILSSSG